MLTIAYTAEDPAISLINLSYFTWVLLRVTSNAKAYRADVMVRYQMNAREVFRLRSKGTGMRQTCYCSTSADGCCLLSENTLLGCAMSDYLLDRFNISTNSSCGIKKPLIV